METEIKEIDIDSPIPNLKIGDELSFDGQYVNGYEFGTSKVVRIYKEVFCVNGEICETELPKPVIALLENRKKILLGFFEGDEFRKLKE